MPEEFFDPDAYILYNDHLHWDTNWAISLENYFDAHFCYLHRDNIQSLLGPTRMAQVSLLQLYRWAVDHNFSSQDGSVMPNQRWDTPEMLAPTDFGVVQWRKLVVTKHFGGCDVPLR